MAMSSATEETTGRPWATPLVSPAGSETPMKSTPCNDESTRAWWRPIIPRPIRPARKFAMNYAPAAAMELITETTVSKSFCESAGCTGIESTCAAALVVSGKSNVCPNDGS